MQQKSTQRFYQITLEYANGMTRTVPVKASSREIAERRALRRNPNALRVKKETSE